MKTPVSLVAACILGSLWVMSSQAQDGGCYTRKVENMVKSAIAETLGPSAQDILQSIATSGREPRVDVVVNSIKEVGPAPGGQKCFATANVWREDTQESFGASLEFVAEPSGAIRYTGAKRD